MTLHYLTMTTNDEHDHLTCSCSCGWTSGPRPMGDGDKWDDVQRELVEQARVYHEAEGVEL
jgi:hypothetical protein